MSDAERRVRVRKSGRAWAWECPCCDTGAGRLSSWNLALGFARVHVSFVHRVVPLVHAALQARADMLKALVS